MVITVAVRERLARLMIPEGSFILLLQRFMTRILRVFRGFAIQLQIIALLQVNQVLIQILASKQIRHLNALAQSRLVYQRNASVVRTA